MLKPPPKFFGVWASDYDNGDAFYSANDSFTAYFDVPTDRGADATGGAREGGMGFVDLLLNFSHPLGNSYEGRWHDDDKAFTVTIRDAGNGTVSMTPKFRNCTADRVTGGTVIDERYGKPCTFGEIYVHDPATTVSLRAPVRTRGGGSPPVVINATNQDLQGNLGQNDTAPRVVEMIGRETKLPDLTGFANFEGEWTIEVRLDRATDRGVNVAGSCTPEAMGLSAYTSECIDGLFQFDPPTAFAGRDYTGVWLDDSTFIITTTLDLTEAMGGQGGNLGLSELRAGVTGTVMNGRGRRTSRCRATSRTAR